MCIRSVPAGETLRTEPVDARVRSASAGLPSGSIGDTRFGSWLLFRLESTRRTSPLGMTSIGAADALCNIRGLENSSSFISSSSTDLLWRG